MICGRGALNKIFQTLSKIGSAILSVLALLKFVFIVAVVGLVSWGALKGVFDSQLTDDEWLAKQTILPEISAIASSSSMTAFAKRTLIENNPALVDRSTLNDLCSNSSGVSFGCFRKKGNVTKILIADLRSSRVSEIVDVTTAHEMLHAAYDDLDEDAKLEFRKMAENFLKNSNERDFVFERLKLYEKEAAHGQLNEVHSILGTEILNLSPELELHYAKFFVNRASVVSKANSFKDIFDSHYMKIVEFDSTIEGLGARIEANQRAARIVEIEIKSKERLANMMSEVEIIALNRQISDYNNMVEEQKMDVAKYNSLVGKRNRVVDAISKLTASIQ